MDNVLTIIMAGGRGERLMPLTKDRCKPAVPFGARYRIIDFVLSNFINSGFLKIKVLTQYMSDSLIAHIHRCWNISGVLDYYVDAVPAQQRTGEDWYLGTANSVYQNLDLIRSVAPDHIAVFGGDHIYKMDVRQKYEEFLISGADVMVSVLPHPRSESSRFGIVKVDDDWNIVEFLEKPEDPPSMPGNPEMSLISLGNYFFKYPILREVLEKDMADSESRHDFGQNIIPRMVAEGYRVKAYDFSKNRVPGEPAGSPYWRDVGDVDTYYDANMDLRSVSPMFNLYNRSWPIRSLNRNLPPAKFVFADWAKRYGQAVDSIVASGTIISGATVRDSVIGSNVFVHSFAHLEGCIILDHVDIGRHVKLRRCIVDKYTRVEPGCEIGFYRERDEQRFTVTPAGVTVLPKNAIIKADGQVLDLITGREVYPPLWQEQAG
ncbi:MAG: glucose-1-phosphate adenylyltransferase [bacterium]